VGAGLAVVVSYTIGAGVLVGYLLSRRAPIKLPFQGFEVRAVFFKDILKVGIFGTLNTLQFQLGILFLTGLAATYGTLALAGLGAALRLEVLQPPISFAFGSAIVAMVGTNIGAGLVERARRIAWTGAAIGAAISGGIGLYGALFAERWIGLFDSTPEVVAAGAAYLHIVAPFYFLTGIGLALSRSTGSARARPPSSRSSRWLRSLMA
jgi:Na+-driven multidrug efflux pump